MRLFKDQTQIADVCYCLFGPKGPRLGALVKKVKEKPRIDLGDRGGSATGLISLVYSLNYQEVFQVVCNFYI